MNLSDLPLSFLRTVVCVFGLLWGSFLNVVIYRVPLGMSVVHPPSHCPACGAPVRPVDNVPILAWVLMRGRARCCGAPVSPRYVLVEAIGGALALAILEVLLRTLPPDAPLEQAAALFGAYFALALGLVAAAFIDAEHMYLPDPITVGGALLGIATASLRGMDWAESLMAASLGYLVVRVLFVEFYKRLRGQPGMGLGDAKLLMLAGAWFGLPGALFVLFAGSIQGSLYAALTWLIRGKIEEPEGVKQYREELEREAAGGDRQAKAALEEDWVAQPQGAGLMARLPFGPFLILGVLEYLFAGPAMLGWFSLTVLGGSRAW